MTNRARPTWPDGAGSANKSAGTPPGANGNGQPNPPTPASNGRTPASSGGTGSSAKGSSGSSGNSGQGRPSTPAGQDPASQRQPRPAPGSTQPNPAANPVRPPQQPPVRPAVKQVPPGPTATPRPGQGGPSTPQRPESRLPGQTPATKASATNAPASQAPTTAPAATPTYGQYEKSSSTTETIGDRVTAAKQAVLGKAAAVKEAATQGVDALSRQGDAATGSGTKPAAKAASSRPRTRKARLRLSRLDPWSVMKTAFLLSIAFGIVTWVAVFIVWSAIGAAGVFSNIDSTVSQVLGSPSAEPFRIENYINTSKVMGFTTLLACADVLIITALATLGSFLYNIAATLLGGLEVTLASEE
jgi:hypothetical protein